MPERVPFQPDTTPVEHEESLERLREMGGFAYEKNEEGPGGTITFLGSRRGVGGADRDVSVSFPTEIEREEEVTEVVESIQQTPLFRKMLTFTAEAYNQRRVPLIQSVPGTGKTFAYDRFSQLLHGKGERGEYLACTPRTNELDIVGHWAPAGGELNLEDLKDKLQEDEKWQSFHKQYQSEVEQLVAQADRLSHTDYTERWQGLQEKYVTTLQDRESAMFGQKTTSNWEFHKGPLLRAFADSSDPNDKGQFAIIDEIDNLPENYQNIFLQISGEKAQLAPRITTYSDSGRVEYQRGPHTFIAFAANYPELAAGKRAVSAPLADRVDWMSITPEESLRDEKLRIEQYSFGGLKKQLEDQEVDPKQAENMRAVMARSLGMLHTSWKKAMADWRAEGIEAGGRGRSREQEKEFSQRAVAGVEEFVGNHTSDPNYADAKTGHVDIALVLADSIANTYQEYAASESLRRRFDKEVLVQVLWGGKKKLQEQPGTGQMELVDSPITAEAAYLYTEENNLFRPFRPESDRLEGALSAQEVLTEQVRRMSVTPEKEETLAREAAERAKHATERVRFALEDKLEAMLESEAIPEPVRQRTGQQLKRLRQQNQPKE